MPHNMDELQQLKAKVEQMENVLALLIKSDRYTISKTMQFLDGMSIQFGRTTGTRIGTGTDQKMSVYGVTPIVQQSSIGGPSTPGGAYSQSEAQSAVNVINSILTALRNFGIIA